MHAIRVHAILVTLKGGTMSARSFLDAPPPILVERKDRYIRNILSPRFYCIKKCFATTILKATFLRQDMLKFACCYSVYLCVCVCVCVCDKETQTSPLVTLRSYLRVAKRNNARINSKANRRQATGQPPAPEDKQEDKEQPNNERR